MKIISTLETPNLTDNRQDGNSTRQINFAIETIFSGNIALCECHSKPKVKPQKWNKYLYDKVVRRLNNEFHQHVFDNQFEFNDTLLTISKIQK